MRRNGRLGRMSICTMGHDSHRLDAEYRVVGWIGNCGEVGPGPATHELSVGDHDSVAPSALNLNHAKVLVLAAHPKLALASPS